MDFSADREFAKSLDKNDSLGSYRSEFHYPTGERGKPVIYFCGNSLGLAPKQARKYMEDEVQDWERLGVKGHLQARHRWLSYHENFAQGMSLVVGAHPEEVVVMNTLTVNLHLAMASFYRPTSDRHKIMIEKGAFPSDQYAVESQIRFHGFNPKESLIEISPEPGEYTIRTENIVKEIHRNRDSLALVMLGGVNYYTGQAFDMKEITKATHNAGAVSGYDLAHAVGNIPLQLHDWNVDFAVWCSYKYLNAGPGAIAGMYAHEKHSRAFHLPRFAGWWGHNKERRFLMESEFQPLPGAEGWQLSNPPIFSMVPLRASLEIFNRAGMDTLRQKSEKMHSYFHWLLQQYSDLKISVISPNDPHSRGCQLSLQTSGNGKELFEHLKKNEVVCDWREPDVIRVAPVPLYNRFEEIWEFVELLRGKRRD